MGGGGGIDVFGNFILGDIGKFFYDKVEIYDVIWYYKVFIEG